MQRTPLCFETLSRRHVDAVERIMGDRISRHFLGGLSPAEPWINHVVASSSYCGLIGFADNDAVGFAALEADGQNQGWLVLCVAETWRRRQFGRCLIEELMERCFSLNVDVLVADVDAANISGMQFFEACGFTKNPSGADGFERYRLRVSGE